MLTSMTMTSAKVLRRAGVVLFVGCLAACGGSSAQKSNGTTPTQSAPPSSDNTQPATPPAPQAPKTIEGDATVVVRENMFPPVDVGAWVCEPRSWNEKREAHLHCTAPAGSGDLLTALKQMPEVVSAEAAN